MSWGITVRAQGRASVRAQGRAGVMGYHNQGYHSEGTGQVSWGITVRAQGRCHGVSQ